MGCKGSKVRILSHRPTSFEEAALTQVKAAFSIGKRETAWVLIAFCWYSARSFDIDQKGHTMDLQLKGKRALVTGGSKGIGKAIAQVLAEEGADVALLARNVDALTLAATEIAGLTGRKVFGVSADTRSDEQVKAAVADAVLRLGGSIDILVNAAAEPAGFAAPPKLAEITGEFYQAEMNTKVMGYIRVAKAVVPDMQAKRWGRIVNISGLAEIGRAHV